MMKVTQVYVDGLIKELRPQERYRGVDPEKVTMLAKSMAAIGLQQPISVWRNPVGAQLRVVAGVHRLLAAQQLGWEQIDAIEIDLNETDRRRWEIAENLHRAELTELERDQHIAEWIRLTHESLKLTQPVSVSQGKGGRGKKGGVREASKELGINREDARRAVKVGNLTPEAKQTALKVGLDDNRSALLKAAAAPAEQQAQVLQDIADTKKARQGDKQTIRTALDDAIMSIPFDPRSKSPNSSWRWNDASPTMRVLATEAAKKTKKYGDQRIYNVILLMDLLGVEKEFLEHFKQCMEVSPTALQILRDECDTSAARESAT